MKPHKTIEKIDKSDQQYHVIGYGLWHDFILDISNYISELAFFNEDHHTLVITSNEKDYNRFFEHVENDLKYYQDDVKIENNVYQINDSTITISKGIENLSRSKTLEKYDILVVYNNNNLKIESDLLLLEDIAKKSIITTLDYKECLFYKCQHNRYIVDDPNHDENIKNLNNSNKATPVLKQGVLAKFDKYDNDYK